MGIDVARKDFYRAVQMVRHAAATSRQDHAPASLTAVSLRQSGDRLVVEGTDRYVLARVVVDGVANTSTGDVNGYVQLTDLRGLGSAMTGLTRVGLSQTTPDDNGNAVIHVSNGPDNTVRSLLAGTKNRPNVDSLFKNAADAMDDSTEPEAAVGAMSASLASAWHGIVADSGLSVRSRHSSVIVFKRAGNMVVSAHEGIPNLVVLSVEPRNLESKMQNLVSAMDNVTGVCF